VVEDATRVMLRLKALFRARGIRTPGKGVYHPRDREEWLAKLADDGARFRAQALYAQLDVLRELRPKVKAAMVTEARRDPAWSRPPWSPRLVGTRPGPCFGVSLSWGRSGSPCSWPSCAHLGDSAPSEISGPTVDWPW
jgi:hypothetical protein